MPESTASHCLSLPFFAQVLWFRNDLRLHDNYVVAAAVAAARPVKHTQQGSKQAPHSSTVQGWANNQQLPDHSAAGAEVLPVYVFDPRSFAPCKPWGIPKTGVYRTKFILESVSLLLVCLALCLSPLHKTRQRCAYSAGEALRRSLSTLLC
jgi:hypothetical protein